jgi:hypothetical protein
VRCDPSNDFLVELSSVTIAYVDPDIAGKRVGENNTQLFSLHWRGDDESILPIVTSILDPTILSIMIAAITGLPDPSQKIRDLWGWLEELNGDGGPYATNVTPIFVNNTAAGWVKAAMKLSNLTLFLVVYRGQHADGTNGAQTPMGGGRSYLPLDDILQAPAEDMIDDISKESDDYGETRRPNPRSFTTTKIGFQKFERKLQKRIISQQRYLEFIRNCALGVLPITSKALLQLRMWLGYASTITL